MRGQCMALPRTLIGIFLDAVARYRKERQFLRKTAQGWEAVSAEHALADVEALGLGLADLGVGRGDRVALLSESRYEWPITDLAILGLGGITVPIYPTLTGEQCRHVLADSQARVAVVSSAAQLEKVVGLLTALPDLG